MIITLAGASGSGKSTIKRMLGERLGWKTYSMGDMREAYAQEHNLTLDELNAQDTQDGKIDKYIDDFQTNLGKTEDNIIIDGWLSWKWIPDSIKIFLEIDPYEGAKRIFLEKEKNPNARADEQRYANVEETMEALKKRLEDNIARYKKWYNITLNDPKNFDISINTTTKTPNEICDEIMAYLQKRA